MDREILFRGFHKEPNGKDIVIINGTPECGTWLYGNLLRTDDGRYIIQNYIPPHMLSKYKVDPSTVGQYTGLTDKNGKKIFAGDIVKQTNFYDNLKVQGPVVYGKAAQYIVRHTYTKQENPYKEGKTKAFAVSPRCEVIGSVHDSPELIGGEDDG